MLERKEYALSQVDNGTYATGFERRLTAVFKGFLYAGMAFIVIMMLITVVHAVGRYAFDQPIKGLVDLSSYLLVLSAFLVGAYTMAVKGHIAMGIFVDRLSQKPRMIIEGLGYIICLAISTLAAWQAVVRGNYMLDVMQSSPVLHIPNYPFVYFVAVGWAIFALAVIMQLVNLFVYRRVEK